MCSVDRVDKIINEVVASFKIDHIEIPIEVIYRAKEILEKRTLNKNNLNKTLIRRINNVK